MNKNQDHTLTLCDYKLLEELRQKYDMAAKMLGSGPSIYFDFNSEPCSENDRNHFTSARQECYTRLTTEYIKN